MLAIKGRGVNDGNLCMLMASRGGESSCGNSGKGGYEGARYVR